jgi:hypothetical protein
MDRGSMKRYARVGNRQPAVQATDRPVTATSKSFYASAAAAREPPLRAFS